jgi:hypothetical protein
MPTIPITMHTPFEQPIAIKPGNGLPRLIRSPADAYVALDGRGPAGLAWTVVRSGLTWMRRGEYRDVEGVRWQLASALWIDDMLLGS